MYIPDWIDDLVEANIPVTIEKSEKLGVYFNLNLEAKSHMYLYSKNGGWFVDMRYDTTIEIESFEDILYAAKTGMFYRDFINCHWAELLVKEGILTVETKTTTTYK